MTKFETLRVIAKQARKIPIVTSLATTSRFFILATGGRKPPENQLPILSSMGSALSVANGIALGRPKREIWAVVGDGEFLMGINAVYTAAALNLHNLTCIVLNNKQYSQTGKFPTHWKYLPMEQAFRGLPLEVKEAKSLKQLKAVLSVSKKQKKPRIIIVKIDEDGMKEKSKLIIDQRAALLAFRKFLRGA